MHTLSLYQKSSAYIGAVHQHTWDEIGKRMDTRFKLKMLYFKYIPPAIGATAEPNNILHYTVIGAVIYLNKANAIRESEYTSLKTH